MIVLPKPIVIRVALALFVFQGFVVCRFCVRAQSVSFFDALHYRSAFSLSLTLRTFGFLV